MDVIRGYKYTFKERELVCVNWEIKNGGEKLVLGEREKKSNLY